MRPTLLDHTGQPIRRESDPLAAASGGRPGPFRLRRWESADTNRLNEAHWQSASGQPINADLVERLATLRTRAAHEAANNGIIDGLLTTHAEDVVGASGPTLQVESDSSAYNDAAESVWQEWFASPCPNRRFSGVQLLKLWIRSLWLNGEFLAQTITSRHAAGPVKMRLKPIHPSRLATPAIGASSARCVLGIEFDEETVPLRYWIQDAAPAGQPLAAPSAFTPVPADMIVHEFLAREEDQARGVPWLAPSLNRIADLRDYDDHVMDAADAAAMMGVAWYTDHANANYIEVNESTSIQRRTQFTGPPGWKPMQLRSEQPAASYVDYRREVHAEIGRPMAVPLMTVRLDASRHNYSSARFDGANYHRVCNGLQLWLSGGPRAYGCLSWLLGEVLSEARFSYRELRARPERIAFRWLWPVPPHVDPTKERGAERLGIETGTLPFAHACMANGIDEEAVFAAEVRTNQRRQAMGLPPLPPPGAYLTGRAAQAEQPDEDQLAEEDGGDDGEAKQSKESADA